YAGDNAELGAFTPGMHQTDSRCFWIDNVNRATISHVNAECGTTLIRDNAVATGEFFIAFHWRINECDFVSVNLLSGKQRPIAKSNCATNFAMHRVESP